MALEKYSIVGTNKFKCAVFINEETYKIPQSQSYYSISDLSYFASVLGTDITPIIEANPNGYTFITFKDGGKIYYDTALPDTSQWSSMPLYITQTGLDIKYRSPSGVVTSLTGGQLQYALYSNASGVIIHFPCYLALALDEVNKLGYFMCFHRNFFTSLDKYGIGGIKILNIGYTKGLNYIYNIFTGNGTVYDPDPWSNGGYADIGGGDGELNLTSDPITLPSLPTSFSETGFLQVFTPSLSQIKELSAYMWSGSLLDNFLKLFNNPMDIIIGLSMLPFSIAPTGSRLVYAGNVVTTVTMPYTSQQYEVIDCGSLEVKNFYNAYIDYEPYTTCEIFLPYIGYEKLSMDDIMGKTVHVVYRVDIITGVCSAFIMCNNILLYTFSGACASNIPVNGQTYTSMAQSVLTIATSTALAGKATKAGSAVANASKGAASSLASNVLSCKPDIQRSGSVSSNVGFLGAQKPHLIFAVPRSCLPKGQNKYLGYPSFMSTKLSSLSGFTVIENIRLENLTCTEAEKEEIMELLKGGVIL